MCPKNPGALCPGYVGPRLLVRFSAGLLRIKVLMQSGLCRKYPFFKGVLHFIIIRLSYCGVCDERNNKACMFLLLYENGGILNVYVCS